LKGAKVEQPVIPPRDKVMIKKALDNCIMRWFDYTLKEDTSKSS